MRCWQLVGVICFMASSSVWASNDEPVPQPASQEKSAQASLSEVGQRLAQHRVEVQRLQRDVARQESGSRQASERLQQKDRTIAELRQQLQALRARPASEQH